MYRINVTLRYRYYENCNVHLGCANIFSMMISASNNYSTEIEAMKLNVTLYLFEFIY